MEKIGILYVAITNNLSRIEKIFETEEEAQAYEEELEDSGIEIMSSWIRVVDIEPTYH